MNVYKRPMFNMQFRANGGPMGEMPMAPPPMDPAMMAPPPMDPAMMAPPPMDPAMMAPPAPDPSQELMATEQMANAGGEGIGALFADQVATALESAEEPKEVIDAIRGNDMPLESRYQELADFVGEEDALATPPSVLTMVQPTIMMTEEGAVNSGIGDLMQNITEGVEMETAEGEATPMAEGVGSLMMGVEQPLTQNFRHGGPVVQHFNNGNEVISNNPFGTDMVKNIKEGYQSFLPTYLEAVDLDAAKDAAQANLLFKIAQTGLAFAGGVSPEGVLLTGSPAQKLAQVTANLPAAAAQATAGVREAEQKAKIGALGAAQAASDRTADAFVARELENVKAAHELTALDKRLDFEGLKLKTTGEREERLSERNNKLSMALQVLKGKQDITSIEARGKIDTELQQIRGEQAILQIDKNQQNLEINLGLESMYDLKKQRQSQDFKFKLQRSINQIKEKELDLNREISEKELALKTEIFKSDETLKNRDLDLREKTEKNRTALEARRVEIQQRNVDLKGEELEQKIKQDAVMIELQKDQNDIQNKRIMFDKQIADRAFELDSSLFDLKEQEFLLEKSKAERLKELYGTSSIEGPVSVVDAIDQISVEGKTGGVGDLTSVAGWVPAVKRGFSSFLTTVVGQNAFSDFVGGKENEIYVDFDKLVTNTTLFIRDSQKKPTAKIDRMIIGILPKAGALDKTKTENSIKETIQSLEEQRNRLVSERNSNFALNTESSVKTGIEQASTINKINGFIEKYSEYYLAFKGGRDVDSSVDSAAGVVDDNTGAVNDNTGAVDDDTDVLINEIRTNEREQ